MSLMGLIREAWHHAVEILTNHDHKTRPPDVDVLFMQELGKLDVDIQHIVAMLYSNYAGSKSSLDMISKDYEKLEEERNELRKERDELKTENMTIIAKGTKAIKECQKDYDTAVQEMREYADKAEDLESALNTSRFFIFLSGMCGFVLGLACLYFVV